MLRKAASDRLLSTRYEHFLERNNKQLIELNGISIPEEATVLLGGTPQVRAACVAACYVACYVPEYCAKYECFDSQICPQ